MRVVIQTRLYCDRCGYSYIVANAVEAEAKANSPCPACSMGPDPWRLNRIPDSTSTRKTTKNTVWHE